MPIPFNVQTVVTLKHIGDDVKALPSPKDFVHHKILHHMSGGSLSKMNREDALRKVASLASAFHLGLATEEIISAVVGAAARIYTSAPLLFETTRMNARKRLSEVISKMAATLPGSIEVKGLAEVMGDIYTAILAETGAVLYPPDLISDIPLGRYIASEEAVLYAFADKILLDNLQLGKASGGGSPMGQTSGGVVAYARVLDAVRNSVTNLSETMSKMLRLFNRYKRVRGYANSAFSTGIPSQAMFDIVHKALGIANFHIWKSSSFATPTPPNETISDIIQAEMDDVLGALRSAPLLKEHLASTFVQQYTRRRIKAKRADTDMLVFLHRNISTSTDAPPTLTTSITMDDVTAIRAIPDDLGTTARMVGDLSNMSSGDGFQALNALRETEIERTLFTDIPHDELLALAMCLSNSVQYTDDGLRRFFTYQSQRPYPNELPTVTKAGPDTFTGESVADVLMLTPDTPSTGTVPVSSGLLSFVAQNKNRIVVIGQVDGSWKDSDAATLAIATVVSPSGRLRYGPTPSDPTAVQAFDEAIARGDYKSMAGTAVIVPDDTSIPELKGPPRMPGKVWAIKACISVTSALDLTYALTRIGIAKDTREAINMRTWPFSVALRLLTEREGSKTEMNKASNFIWNPYMHVPQFRVPTMEEALAVASKENSTDPDPVSRAKLEAAARAIINSVRTERTSHYLPFDKLGTTEERGLALSLVTSSLISYYVPLITSQTVRKITADIFAYVRYPFIEPEGIEETTNYINVAHAVLVALTTGLGFENGYQMMLEAIFRDQDAMRNVVQSLATTRSGAKFGNR